MAGPTITVFYHGDCLDGFAAAWCAWRRFGAAADYRPMHYGDPFPDELVFGREVYVLDFSAGSASLDALAERASRLLLLDHHATPFRDWQARLVDDPPTGLWRFDDPVRRMTVGFDLARSGARIAWDWFAPGEPLPRLIAHVEDQDLWRFALPGTRAFCRALRLRPFDFPVWNELAAECGAIDAPLSPAGEQILIEGAAIDRFLTQEVERLGQGPAMPIRLRGEPLDAGAKPLLAIADADGRRYRPVDGLCVNANALFASELGEVLARRSGTFGMTWYGRADGRVKVSLRAAGGVDVARIAERYGGGGHPNAAGITLSFGDFCRQFLDQATPVA